MSTTPIQPEATPNEEQADQTKPGEKLVLQYPDASVGRPRRLTTVWPMIGGTLGTALVAGGALLTMVAASARPVMGATRSCKLKWDRRAAEINQAVAAQQAPAAPAALTSAPAPTFGRAASDGAGADAR